MHMHAAPPAASEPRPSNPLFAARLASLVDGRSVQHRGPFVLRVEVALVRATVLVRFTAGDKRSPPYRLINRLRIAVYCSQQGVPGMLTRVPPRGSAAYVLDAPSLPPIVEMCLPEVSSEPLASLNLSRIGEQVRVRV